MTIARAIAILLGSVAACAALGCGIGYGLGRFIPGYYRSVFDRGTDPQFDPISIGIGQGLTQGVAGGVAVGVALVALFIWRDVQRSRLQYVESRRDSADGATTPVSRSPMIIAILLALVIGTVVGMLIGVLAAYRSAFHSRFDDEHSLVAPVLANDPVFTKLAIEPRSRGGVDLRGPVPSRAEWDRLREALVRALAEDHVDEMLNGVWIEKE